MEEINFDVMRYDLDENGYILNVYFGCASGTCQAYEGEVPEDYFDLQDWSNNAEIRAYKIVNGNLVLDKAKEEEIQTQCECEAEENRHVSYKELFEVKKSITDAIAVDDDKYKKVSTHDRQIIGLICDVKKCFPKIKLTQIKPYSYDNITLISCGKNLFPNDATSQIIDGITFTQNEDRSITINGTAEKDIEYNLWKTSENTSPFLCFVATRRYELSCQGFNIKMYNYDGTDREEVFNGSDGTILFNESKYVTHITLNIPSGTTIENQTLSPLLEWGIANTFYEPFKSQQININFAEYIKDGLFPSETLFPNDELFGAGTTIKYISIENGEIIANINDEEFYLGNCNITLYDGDNALFTLEDVYINIEYAINQLNVESLEFLQGLSTNTNKFKILEDGSIEAHNGYFSGNLQLEDDSLISNFTMQSIDPKEVNSATTKYLGSGILIESDTVRDTYLYTYLHRGMPAIMLGNEEDYTSIFPYGINTPVLTQTSLKGKKKNFEPLENALDIIKNTDIYKYHLKSQSDEDKKHIGFIIGDDFNYSKEITSSNNDGVDIYSMVSVCLKAIQEQQKIIEELKSKLERND